MPKLMRHINWIHDLMLSLCYGLLVGIYLNFRPRSFVLDQLVFPLYLWRELQANVSGRPSPQWDPYQALCVAFSMLALIGFVCLRILGRTPLLGFFACRAAGIVVVAGFPLLFLLSTDPLGRPLAPVPWSLMTAGSLWLEVLAAITCVALYLFRRRWMKPAVSMALVLLHFGLWFWLLPGSHWIVLLFACTSVVWGLRVRLPDRSGRWNGLSAAHEGAAVR